MKKNILFFSIIGLALIIIWGLYYNTQKKITEISMASLLPFDGKVADMGEMMKNGQTLALEEINANLKNPKDSLKLYFFNTSHKKDVALDKMKEAYGRGIRFFVEIFGSDQVDHCIPYALQKDLFLLSGVDTKPDLVEKGKGCFFRIMPNDAAASNIILNWAKDLSIKKAAILYANDDWGRGLKDAAVKMAQKYNIEIIDTRDVITNQPSFSALATLLKVSNPDAVFLFVYADDGGRFLKEAQRQKLVAKFFATENFTGEKLVNNAKDAADGVMIVIPLNNQNSINLSNFTQKYIKRFNQQPTVFSIKGYDAVKVLYDVILNSGQDVNKAKKIIKEYKSIGISSEISFDKSGEFIPNTYDRMRFSKEGNTYVPKPIRN